MGWISEVIYAAYKNNRFVNRGFLNGPFCPIYGFGMLLLIVLLDPIKNNIVLLFLCAVILTSLLEYITGFILEKAFNSTWWDYSTLPFNIKGRICLRFSIAWGIFSVIIIKLVHPHIENLIILIPENYGTVIVYIIIAYFLTDFIITVHSVVKLNSLLRQLHNIRQELSANLEHLKILTEERAEDRVEEIEKKLGVLKLKYESLVERRNIIHSRLITAFPNLYSKNFDSILKEIRNKIHSRI